MVNINEHVLGVKQNLLEKYNFYDKYYRKLFQTQVTVVCKALSHRTSVMTDIPLFQFKESTTQVNSIIINA